MAFKSLKITSLFLLITSHQYRAEEDACTLHNMSDDNNVMNFTNVKGVDHFPSVINIQRVSYPQLRQLLPKHKAKDIKDILMSNNTFTSVSYKAFCGMI